MIPERSTGNGEKGTPHMAVPERFTNLLYNLNLVPIEDGLRLYFP